MPKNARSLSEKEWDEYLFGPDGDFLLIKWWFMHRVSSIFRLWSRNRECQGVVIDDWCISGGSSYYFSLEAFEEEGL